jgi:hypothetical protein
VCGRPQLLNNVDERQGESVVCTCRCCWDSIHGGRWERASFPKRADCTTGLVLVEHVRGR